jgi:ABC-type antimicrobial peptide transport system permease subunit
MSGYSDAIQKAVTSMMMKAMTRIGSAVQQSMTEMMTQLASGMQDALQINPDAFADAITINTDQDTLQEIFLSLMTSETATYDGNLRKIGFADLQKPASISIYPKDFASKEEIIRILDDYNERMRAEDEEKIITYTDYVGLLMSSVTNIIDTVSYVLIAFVAISLIVSSIMIGVITYISVLERKKEIGILRAIGASKRNISQVFNAETFIIGLLAGIFGISISLLLLIPGNQLIHSLAGNNDVNAFLQPRAAVILIILSVILTLIGGIIPSRKAARSDPVTALRTE